MNRIDPLHLQHERPIAGVLNKPQVRGNRSLGYNEVRLHVSDLMKVSTEGAFCEREHVIRKLFNPTIPVSPLSASFELLFDLGNALHDSARRRWMRYDPYGDKRVLARWECPCGNTKHVGVNPRAIICNSCGFPATVFDEYEVFDPELHIVAHPDFTIVKGSDVIRQGAFDKDKHTIRIVEIKGIDRVDVDWYRLDGPLGEHTLQGSFYYHLMKRAGYRVDKRVSYLYGDRRVKETLFTGEPWKEFEVEASPYPRVEKFFKKARRVSNSIEERVVPERKVCEKIGCTRAKNCSIAGLCFGMEKDAHKAPKKVVRKKLIRKRPAPLVI